MSESSRQALVVDINLKPHIQSDNLSLVEIDGFTCVVNTKQWEGKNKACYIVPQTIVDVTRPEFSFLRRPEKNRDKETVTVRKFRGVWSQGLLVPVADDIPVGTDLWDFYGLEHYEPEPEVEGLKSGDCSSAPPYWASLSKYDIENWRKYKYLFLEGEPVSILDKVNGSNMSCVYSDGAYHVKSRNLWKKESEWSDFWKALNNNEPLKKYLRDHENTLFVGELTGKVGGFTYGLKPGEVEFKAFDIRKKDYTWMDQDEFIQICTDNDIKTPQIFEHGTPYSEEVALRHVDGIQEGTKDKIREGIVIKSMKVRFEPKLNGRLALKLVSNVYLEKTGKR